MDVEDVLSFDVCPYPSSCFQTVDIDSPHLFLVSEFLFLYLSHGLDAVVRRCLRPGAAAATEGEKARSPLKPESKPLSSLPPPWGWQVEDPRSGAFSGWCCRGGVVGVQVGWMQTKVAHVSKYQGKIPRPSFSPGAVWIGQTSGHWR